MKLKQRIVLAYYSNKFKSIALLSPRQAAISAFKLFCTPYSRQKNIKPTPIFDDAEILTLQVDTDVVHGYRWLPKQNIIGKKILICHGFDSCSYRFGDYVAPLLNQGFEVMAFDAPAHGKSTGKTITILHYGKMIQLINETYGPIYGIMAHSMGGLATVLAIENMEDNPFKKLVLVAPSTETAFAIQTFFRYLKLSMKVRTEFLKLVEELGGNPAEWYSVARAIENITPETLWVHDKKDTITPYSHMEHLARKKLPHLQFEITEDLGHSPYKDPAILQRIVSFFAS